METETLKSCNIWNRDTIKYIAVFTMLLNHISQIFMKQGTFWAELFLDIGYFTAITMCYFLVEGYQYTSSKKKYACRLAGFAIISEIPFCLAFTKNGIMEFIGFNMIFTLLICFFILLSIEKISNYSLRVLVVTGLIMLSGICDWAIYAPMFTLLFVWAKNSKKRLKIAYIISCVSFGLYKFAEESAIHAGKNLIFTLGSMAGIALSGIVIICLYKGKRMEKGRTFSKWFFYIFYPLHLLILGIIRIAVLHLKTG